MLAQLEGDTIVAGIGINVSQTGFPDDLETPATSLFLEGVTASREDLLVARVKCVDRYTQLSSRDFAAVHRRLELRPGPARARR